MTAPRRQPIGPAQVETASRQEQLVGSRQEGFGLGEVFQHIGANHQVVVSQPIQRVFVEVDAEEGAATEFGKQVVLLIREGHGATPTQEFSSKDAMATAQI